MKLSHALAFAFAMTTSPLLTYAQEHSRFASTAGYIGQQTDADAPITINPSDIPVACQDPYCAELESSSDDGGAALGLSWYVTSAIAIELWGSQGHTSNTELDMERSPDAELTSYRARPLAPTAQYHLRLSDRFIPFIGIGWQETVTGVMGNVDVAKTAGLNFRVRCSRRPRRQFW
ncbi:OmpW family outer membrane protein [Pseudoxanthomonas sp. UTMC 1351]|uniref:OmpW family outer membrane protein n=1 Tax=Pseudoxanthomonas sp. UTMC 1351 TaxID=2695853 RepID=UPI0034CF869D